MKGLLRLLIAIKPANNGTHVLDYGGGYEKSMHNRIYKIKYAIPQSSQT